MLHEAVDRGEPAVPCGRSVSTFFLEVLQESQHYIVAHIIQVQLADGPNLRVGS